MYHSHHGKFIDGMITPSHKVAMNTKILLIYLQTKAHFHQFHDRTVTKEYEIGNFGSKNEHVLLTIFKISKICCLLMYILLNGIAYNIDMCNS